MSKTKAFTLVELAIVLVVIGLVVGGVMAGQSMLRASDLQSIISDVARYKSITSSFKEKYGSFPGDMNNATSTWEAAPACPAAGTNQQTCNGNGDGQIYNWSNAATSYEMFRFWQHLVLSGMLEGDFTGAAGSGGALEAVPGVNVPTSRLGGGYTMAYIGIMNGNAIRFDGDWGHIIRLGNFGTATAANANIFSVADARVIDIKMDDGAPATGSVVTYKKANGTTSENCASSNAVTAIYDNTQVGIQCILEFKTGF